MTWLELGITAAALGASINIADKIVIERYYKDIWTYPFFMSFFLFIYSLGLIAVRSSVGLFRMPPYPVMFIVLLPGLMHYISATLITKAFMHANAATVSALNQVRPVFALVWGTFVLGEFFTLEKYAGMFLIIICTALISVESYGGISKKHTQKIKINPAYFYVLLGAFIFSIGELSIKISLEDVVFWDVYALSRVTLILPCAIVFFNPNSRKIIVDTVTKTGIRFLIIVGIIEVAAMIGLLLIISAFDRGSLALVSSTSATGPMFVLLFTLLLNRIKPNFVPTKDKHSLSLAFNFLLCIGIAIGVYIIQHGT